MKNLIASFLFFFLISNITMAQMVINIDNTAADPSAGLDVKFSDKGLLPPRVELTSPSVATPIVSPAIGLLVYNTATAGNPPDNVVPGYYFWDGSMWKSFVVSPGTTGQTLRNDGGNWIANSVLFNDGTNIGIGMVNPTHKLTIAGPAQTLRLIGPGSFGSTSQLNFGDGDYVYLSEDVDDNLLIHATGRKAITGGNVGIVTTSPGQPLTVAGIIQTTSGGVMFPDGTTQTTATAANVHTIGEFYGGGRVFYIYDGGQHGLIADTANLITFARWNNGSITTTNAVRDDVFAGQFNTNRIVINQGTGNYAAQVCANCQSGGFGDWYLPSKYELNLLYQQKAILPWVASGGYWSSTEYNADYAWIQYFTSGLQGFTGKASTLICMLAIRAF